MLSPARPFTILALLVVSLVSTACGNTESETNLPAAQAAPAQSAPSLAGGQVAPTTGNLFNRAGGQALSKSEAPFVPMSGYFVRGSDEASFLTCGTRRVHLARMSAGAAARMVQSYRFRAPRLLAPVYFEVRARVVEDTVTVGEHTYRSVIEIQDADVKEALEPQCAAPPSGSLVASDRGR